MIHGSSEKYMDIIMSILYEVPMATVTYYHKFGGLRAQTYSLKVLEARSPKLSCTGFKVEPG